MNKEIGEKSEESAQSISNWFNRNEHNIELMNLIIFQEVYFIQFLGTDAFDNVLQTLAQEIGTGAATYNMGVYLQACADDETQCDEAAKYLDPAEQEAKQTTELALLPKEELKGLTLLNPSEHDYTDLEEGENYEDKVRTLMAEIGNIFNNINQAEPVDYRIVKADLNVRDQAIKENDESYLNEIERMKKSLYEQAQDLEFESKKLKEEKNLYAFAGMGPMPKRDYILASKEAPLLESTVTIQNTFAEKTNHLDTATLEPLLSPEFKAIDEIGAPASSGPCTAGLCLPDLITGSGVPVVPVIEDLAGSETLFLPSGHLVYSDGRQIYLKEDLVQKKDYEYEDVSIKTHKLNQSFLDKIGQTGYIMESINMLETTLTEDGSSSFKWLPTTHSDVYGYGLEIEKSIRGFDHAQQNNGLADVVVIMLPADEEGNPPDMFANGEQVPFDTLITSFDEADEAEKIFGIKAGNTLTQKTEITFPSINNAQIFVGERRAVYVKVFQGAATNLQMENAF